MTIPPKWYILNPDPICAPRGILTPIKIEKKAYKGTMTQLSRNFNGSNHLGINLIPRAVLYRNTIMNEGSFHSKRL